MTIINTITLIWGSYRWFIIFLMVKKYQWLPHYYKPLIMILYIYTMYYSKPYIIGFVVVAAVVVGGVNIIFQINL